MDRPTNHIGKSQRVLKGSKGVLMILGIIAEQSLHWYAMRGTIRYRTPEEPTDIILLRQTNHCHTS